MRISEDLQRRWEVAIDDHDNQLRSCQNAKEEKNRTRFISKDFDWISRRDRISTVKKESIIHSFRVGISATQQNIDRVSRRMTDVHVHKNKTALNRRSHRRDRVWRDNIVDER